MIQGSLIIPVKEPENMKEIEEMRGVKSTENIENRYTYTQNDQKIGTASLQESYRNAYDNTIEEILNKAMAGTQNNNKGYFTKNDWMFTCQMWPNLHWTEEEAEQRLHALLEEGKIREIEGPGSGKFVPTEKLSSSSAGSIFKG
jgi:hypothetical protein